MAIHPVMVTRVMGEKMATSQNRAYVKHPTMVLLMGLNAPITPTAENKFLSYKRTNTALANPRQDNDVTTTHIGLNDVECVNHQ